MANNFYKKHLDRNRIKSDKIDQLLDQMELFGATADVISLAGQQFRKKTPTTRRWAFVMISPKQNNAVIDWLEEHSSRKHRAIKLWLKLFEYLHSGTGEIMASRDDLARTAKVSPDNVSRIMSELTSINAIKKVKQGRHVVYYMNPNIGTNFTAEKRDDAQQDFGQLSLI